MTTLREAAEKSLEMLEHFQNVTRIGSHDSNAWNHFHRERFMRADVLADETIISLRAALAAEQEPRQCTPETCMFIDGLGREDCDFCAPRSLPKNIVAGMLRSYIEAIKQLANYEAWHYIPDIEEEAEQLEANQPQAGWKLVADEKPPEGVPVWLREEDRTWIGTFEFEEDGWHFTRCYSVPRFLDGAWECDEAEWDDPYEPTHWMLLPAAPEAK